MTEPQSEKDKTQANVLAAVGVVLALVGGIGARVGTTNMGLFVVFVILFLGGIGCIAASQKVRNRKYGA